MGALQALKTGRPGTFQLSGTNVGLSAVLRETNKASVGRLWGERPLSAWRTQGREKTTQSHKVGAQ